MQEWQDLGKNQGRAVRTRASHLFLLRVFLYLAPPRGRTGADGSAVSDPKPAAASAAGCCCRELRPPPQSSLLPIGSVANSAGEAAGLMGYRLGMGQPQSEHYWFQCLWWADAGACPIPYRLFPKRTFLNSSKMA